MLHVETVLPDTLALLRRIQAMPELSAMRLVGGTALALLLGSYMRKFAVSEYSYALRGLTYFDDAEDEQMPVMLASVDWETVKRRISAAVRDYLAMDVAAAENERGKLDAEKETKAEEKGEEK